MCSQIILCQVAQFLAANHFEIGFNRTQADFFGCAGHLVCRGFHARLVTLNFALGTEAVINHLRKGQRRFTTPKIIAAGARGGVFTPFRTHAGSKIDLGTVATLGLVHRLIGRKTPICINQYIRIGLDSLVHSFAQCLGWRPLTREQHADYRAEKDGMLEIHNYPFLLI